MLNVEKIKKDFSMFTNNPQITYLDSAATSLTPDCVVDEMTDYYKKYRTSVHRGSYKLAQKANEKFENSREKIAKYLNVNSQEIIFTKSTTSSINLIAKSLEETINENDEIIITELEHHSNFLPWLELSKKRKAKLIVIKAENLQINTETLLNKITNKTKIIVMHHISNVIGDEMDIKKICNYAQKKNILTIVDGAQGAPHLKIDLKAIQCDFYTISAHKMLGPTGLGVLYVNQNLATKIPPFEYGGDMVEPGSVGTEEYIVKEIPFKYEAGTPPIAEVIGFGKAIEYLENLGIENIHEHEKSLKKYAINKMQPINNMIEIYNSQNDSGIITFNIKNVAVHDAISESLLSNITFDTEEIYIRDGQHCNNLTMKHVIKKNSALRASIYIYNDEKDIDKLIETIIKIYNQWN